MSDVHPVPVAVEPEEQTLRTVVIDNLQGVEVEVNLSSHSERVGAVDMDKEVGMVVVVGTKAVLVVVDRATRTVVVVRVGTETAASNHSMCSETRTADCWPTYPNQRKGLVGPVVVVEGGTVSTTDWTVEAEVVGNFLNRSMKSEAADYQKTRNNYLQ